jgi:fructose-1,6-bisphosphatase II / sedoheptulose-1,7-bisphosphatase
MSIDPKYLNLFIKATEKGAIGASKFIGKKDKIAADKGAVDPMRKELNKINMEGTVVIGEGEMDEAPMLYIGEKLGTLNGPKFDIAVDPLEGTKFTANNQPNAFSVIAIAEQGNLLSAPDTYMEKVAVGANLPKNLLDLDNNVKKNISLLADAKKKKISEINACVLKRPRHDHIVKELTKMGVQINYITDGDIAGALTVIGDNPKNDIYYSTGGGPEGVIVAACIILLWRSNSRTFSTR